MKKIQSSNYKDLTVIIESTNDNETTIEMQARAILQLLNGIQLKYFQEAYETTNELIGEEKFFKFYNEAKEMLEYMK